MIKIKAAGFDDDFHGGTMALSRDIDTIKFNMSKIFSTDELLAINKILSEQPYIATVFVPFKQFIVHLILNKLDSQSNSIVFYNCHRELHVAEAMKEQLPDAAKEDFINTFYTVLANYNPDDLAEIEFPE